MSRELTVKIMMPMLKYRFLPLMSDNLPNTGINAAIMMNFAIGTHMTTFMSARKSRAIFGSIRVTSPVSNDTAKVARLMIMRATHLYSRPRRICMGFNVASAFCEGFRPY